MVEFSFLITAFTTLFVIVDPIGLAPIFMALTQGMSPAHRRRIAIRATFTGFCVLMTFALFGEAILGFVGISMPAFRIAGGVLLFLTALDMLFERRQTRRQGQADEAEADDPESDPSIFPIAVPLLAGPGSIATVILLAGEADGWGGFAAIMSVLLVVMLIAMVLFQLAGVLGRILGRTGIAVFTRILGMLLAALAIQFILDGITGFGEGLTIIRGGR